MALIDNVKQLAGEDLGGLVKKFEEGGYADQARSWVATGANKVIDSGAIDKVLGHETVAGIGKKVGLDTKQTAAKMADLLPKVVDRLTPEGKVPPQEQVKAELPSIKEE
jgi:uncharacterized protein YidB (DUF937 family)